MLQKSLKIGSTKCRKIWQSFLVFANRTCSTYINKTSFVSLFENYKLLGKEKENIQTFLTAESIDLYEAHCYVLRSYLSALTVQQIDPPEKFSVQWPPLSQDRDSSPWKSPGSSLTVRSVTSANVPRFSLRFLISVCCDVDRDSHFHQPLVFSIPLLLSSLVRFDLHSH